MHSHTLTISRAQNHKPHITNDSANHVEVMSKYFDTPRNTNLNFSEQNTQFATRRCRSVPTSNFYLRNSTRASYRTREIRKSPTNVRVFSEYSDTPNSRNLNFPERNTRVVTVERKSTLTSFLNLHAPVGQAFQPDKCACPFAKPSCSATAFLRLESLTCVRQIGSKIPQIARSLSESSQMNKTRTIVCTRNVKNGGVLLAHEGRQPGAIQSILIG
jgi:hypothetical protein